MYELLTTIKKPSGGDHSSVHKAVHKQTGTILCIKRIRLDKLKNRDKVYQALQKNEIQTLQYVDHPKIIRVLGMPRIKNVVNIVMEYASHGSLNDWIKKKFTI